MKKWIVEVWEHRCLGDADGVICTEYEKEGRMK